MIVLKNIPNAYLNFKLGNSEWKMNSKHCSCRNKRSYGLRNLQSKLILSKKILYFFYTFASLLYHSSLRGRGKIVATRMIYVAVNEQYNIFYHYDSHWIALI